MTVDEMHTEVLQILTVILKKDLFDGEVKRSEIDEWDSLRHLEVIFSVEDAFSVKFDEEELPKLNTSLVIAEAISAKKKADGAG